MTEKLQCPKCWSTNVCVQSVWIAKNQKHKWCLYRITVGWFIEPLLRIVLTVPKLIFEIFRPKKMKTEVKSYATCQDCGKHWEV